MVQNFLNTIIHFILKTEIKKNILELGSGEGQICSLLHKLGFEIYGIDNDLKELIFKNIIQMLHLYMMIFLNIKGYEKLI